MPRALAGCVGAPYLPPLIGAWPSGKAPVFGIGIPGSNPGAPAKFFKYFFFIVSYCFMYYKFLKFNFFLI